MPSIVMMTILGGKVQRGFGTRYRLMVARRRLALSGVPTTSTTQGSGKNNALIAFEEGSAKEDGDGFYSIPMQCTLRVC